MISMNLSHQCPPEYDDFCKACNELNKFLPKYTTILVRHPDRYTPEDKLVQEEFAQLSEKLSQALYAWKLATEK